MLGIYDAMVEQEDAAFESQVWIYALDLFKEQLDPIANRSFIQGLTVDKLKQEWTDLVSKYRTRDTNWSYYNEVGHILKSEQANYKLEPLQRKRTVPEALVQARVIEPLKRHGGDLDLVSYEKILEIHRQQNEWFLKQQDQFFERFHTAMTGQSPGGRLTAFEEFQLKRKANRDEQVVDYKRARPFS
ncbi:unnamed protein product [Rhizopus stolonifer]